MNFSLDSLSMIFLKDVKYSLDGILTYMFVSSSFIIEWYIRSNLFFLENALMSDMFASENSPFFTMMFIVPQLLIAAIRFCIFRIPISSIALIIVVKSLSSILGGGSMKRFMLRSPSGFRFFMYSFNASTVNL